MDKLHQHTTYPLPSNLQLEYETIDVLTCGLMDIAEKIAGTYSQDKFPVHQYTRI